MNHSLPDMPNNRLISGMRERRIMTERPGAGRAQRASSMRSCLCQRGSMAWGRVSADGPTPGLSDKRPFIRQLDVSRFSRDNSTHQLCVRNMSFPPLTELISFADGLSVTADACLSDCSASSSFAGLQGTMLGGKPRRIKRERIH